MPVISYPEEFHAEDLYVDLRSTLGTPLLLKCEGFNFAGSIKLKAAVRMVDGAERAGRLTRDSVLIESSSGNLGVALSMIAASRGYGFVCVTDARCNLAARRLIETFGGQVHMITEPDRDGGLLGARIAYVRRRCEADPNYVWLNQYANPNNWLAHQASTAPAIARRFPNLDVLFVGAGTTGTLMGCARYFREHAPQVTVVAVDSEGSVTFGGPARPRMIPGLGTSVRPALLDESYVDDVVHVAEADAINTCRRLATRGFVFGGSTGTVIAGATGWLSAHRADREVTAVAISPDLGERYLDSVYQQGWVEEIYGRQAWESDQIAAH
ncbi:MAG TPA: 2,3-diaminopropionate biosynthesis protein SbnA [Pseudonocardiaceae bacterium]|nr:2,3-diaminopropionate biosynthesis protein SbnA [Pseudonocardiaceae bacterium]